MATPLNILGFDIGGTKIAACLARGDGTIICSKRIKTEGLKPSHAIELMANTGAEMLDSAGMTTLDVRAIGIGSPAPHDVPGGRILSPPNMKGWDDVPVRDMISGALGVEAFFDNDANGGALAEWFFGSGKGADDMVYLTMSTGIGGGIIAKKHLIQGAGHMAGEIGHIVLDPNGPQCNCGLKGCYEAFCGGRAVAQRIRKDIAAGQKTRILEFAGGNPANIDFATFRDAVRIGEVYAKTIWDEVCERHAQAIGIVANIFNPEKIILGTIALHSGDLMMNPIRASLPKYAWPSAIEVMDLAITGLGDKVGEYSGVAVALNCLYERGEWQLPW